MQNKGFYLNFQTFVMIYFGIMALQLLIFFNWKILSNLFSDKFIIFEMNFVFKMESKSKQTKNYIFKVQIKKNSIFNLKMSQHETLS